MARSTVAVLGRALKSATSADGTVVRDQELLRRFTDENDQFAFAALVSRHTGMVLGVCRRALSHLQDAEDACQATFLILARKARSVRWQASVANWLFTTARKVARNARVAAERRARREGRAASRSVVNVDRMTGRELLAALDEELDRLPPRYREPLVLCYLEGLTRDEAATRLGVPVATIKSQLERGRNRLHDALIKGGCAVGAGLLAFAVTSPAGASSPRLVKSILAAASGSPSAAVAALAKEVAVNEMLRRSLLAALVLIGTIAVGIGLGAMALPAADPPPQVKADKPPPEVRKETTVAGRVLDSDGKPVAGAKLSLLANRDEPIDLGTTGSDGRFKVQVPADQKSLFLIARIDGVGIDFLDVGKRKSADEVELRMVKDRPIRGRVVDTQGKPVAGVKVSVRSLGVYADNSLDSFLAQWKNRHPQSGIPGGVKHLWREAGTFPVATTDAEGRFTINGVGAERMAILRVRGAGIAESEVFVVNREGFDPKPYNQATADKLASLPFRFGGGWILHGPDPAVVAEAEKPIRGVVKELDTGKPRVGVTVSLTREGNDLVSVILTAQTDAEGRYEIHGARKGKGYMVEVKEDADAGLMPSQVRAADTAGYEPITADIGVKKGVVITGKVINATTKQGMPGFAHVSVLNDNPFVKDFPEFNSSAWMPRGEAGEDGSFRVVTIPGPVLLMGGPDHQRGPDGFAGLHKFKPPVPDPKYPRYFDTSFGHPTFFTPGGGRSPIQGNFCKVLEIKPGTEVVKEDIVLEIGVGFPVKIQDANGQPLTGVWVTGLAAEEWHHPLKMDKDVCEAYHLDANKPRLMAFWEPSKKQVGTLTVKGDEKGEVVVKLGQPGSVKGRLLDENGRPLVGIPVVLYHKERTAAEIQELIHRSRVNETDAEGKFRIDEVIPGVKFFFPRFLRGKQNLKPVDKPGDWIVKAGETLDVGDLKLKADGPNDE